MVLHLLQLWCHCAMIGQHDRSLQELNNYLTLETQTSMIVDRSAQGELLRINFNISFPALSCEFATLDVSDALGTVSHVPWCCECTVAMPMCCSMLTVACLDRNA